MVRTLHASIIAHVSACVMVAYVSKGLEISIGGFVEKIPIPEPVSIFDPSVKMFMSPSERGFSISY